MTRIGEIYGLHLDDGVIRYVGLTTQGVKRRFDVHLRAATKESTLPVYRWMRKYGLENIRFTVLDTLEEENIHLLPDLEMHHIATQRLAGGADLNCTDGGEGLWGYKHTEESCAKMSAAKKGKPMSAEHRAKISASHKGKCMSVEARAKISAALTGRTLSEEHKANISKPRSAETRAKGKPKSAEHRAKMSAAKKGKPNKSNHTRFHTNRNIVNLACVFCQEVSS